jgi:hypothetical protein
VSRRVSPRDAEHQRKQKRARSLSDEERLRLRIALRNLQRTHGSWKKLSELTGVAHQTMKNVVYGSDFGSMRLAVSIADFCHVPVRHLLSGEPILAGRCPLCGQVMPTDRDTG